MCCHEKITNKAEKGNSSKCELNDTISIIRSGHEPRYEEEAQPAGEVLYEVVDGY